MTLREVACRAGVHPATASRALNEGTRSLVNDETAQRILKAAEDLSYRPNRIARGLKTSRSYTVGVLVPDIQNPLFPPIVRGIEDRLGETGYTPLIANTENDSARERRDLEAMYARQVDGLITATARRDHDLLDEIVALGVPLVLVNRRVENGTLPSVTVDDRSGVRLAVEHLAGLRHRGIAYLAGPQDLSTAFHRYVGFVDAMGEAGLELDRGLTVFGKAFTESEGASACRELLDRERPFTAIVAGNDLMALGCYDVLAERGLECPGDVSVVGFNDMPFADRFNPPLTTIRIPHYEMGVAAADLLLALLRTPDRPQRDVLLAPEFIERKSTGPPRS